MSWKASVVASLRASTSPIIGAGGGGSNKGATGGATGGSSCLPGSVGPCNLSGGGLWVIGLGNPVGVVVGVVPTLLLRGSISSEGESGGVWPGEDEAGVTGFSYLSHASFIIQNTKVMNMLLSSYKTRFDGLLIV